MGQYQKASSVTDACRMLKDNDGETEVIAGGQTLMLNIRQGLKQPDLLVDISDIGELQGVTDEGDTVEIGSATTYAEIGKDPTIQESFPILADAITEIAGPQVRHNGTIGGGICYGDPALDTPPVLLALDAHIVLEGPDGTRQLPVSDFFVGYYETDLQPEEILTRVEIPKLPDHSAGCYRTMTPRQGDYASAGVATRLTFDGDTCEEARISLTNAGDTPMRATEAETSLEGTGVSDEKVEEAANEVVETLDILDEQQIPKSYRETVFRRLARHTVKQCREEVIGQ